MAISDLLQGPGEKNKVTDLGVAGFKAASVTRKTVEANATAPTAWLEDGPFVHDHIILDPVTQVVEGEVGDVYLQQSPEFEAFQEAQAGLGQAVGYLPEQTQAQVQRGVALAATVRDGVNQAQQAISAGENVAQYFGLQESEKPLGEQFVDTIMAIRNARQLIQVELSGRKWDNMAIVGVSVTRDNEDRAIAFEISFQQLRFAQTVFQDPSDPFPDAGAGTNGSTQGAKDKGAQSGEETESSALFELGEAFGVIGG